MGQTLSNCTKPTHQPRDIADVRAQAMGGFGEAVSRVEVWTCWDLGGRFQREEAGRPCTRPFSSLKSIKSKSCVAVLTLICSGLVYAYPLHWLVPKRIMIPDLCAVCAEVSIMLSIDHHSPSKPTNPVSKNTGKYRFFSRDEHQFHALVSLPSIQLPASKKLSAPDPSNP